MTNRQKIFGVMGAVLLSFAAGETAWAATYYVATNGSDSNNGSVGSPFKTVQKAVGVVRAGDTVVIKAGRHAPFGLRNINGNSGAPITFKGEPGAIIDRYLGGANAYRSIEFWGGSYITIDGLELTDSEPFRGPAVNCTTVRKGSHSGRNAIKTNKGSNGQYPHHLVIKNLHMHNTGGSGFLGSADDVQFLYNHIHDNGDAATNQLAYGTYIKGQRWVIKGNRIHNNNGNGMRTGNSTATGLTELLVDSIIENNVIYNNNGQGAHPSGPTGCRIINGGDGIVVWHGSGNIIRNNIVYNSGSFGIRVNEDFGLNNKPNLVYNNTVYKNGSHGVYCYDGDKTIVKNNIVYLSGKENIFNGCSNQLSNNVTTDPQFVNAASGDFGLQESSPAIDKGFDLPKEVPTDFTGKARPENGKWDIGAFEGAGSKKDVLPDMSGAGFLPGGVGGSGGGLGNCFQY